MLVRAARNGDDQAFTRLMEEEKARLYRIAYAYLHSRPDALDALQETAFRAFRSIRKLHDHALFSTWITRILLNYCADERKRQKRTVPPDYAAPTEVSGPQPDNLDLYMALDSLQPSEKQLVILKYMEDWTYPQIAALLQMPESTVKTRARKALDQLKSILGREDKAYGGA
ncbi:sigma-70 family RNA polymerase sigma factor [Paenibacillus sp. UNC499MF]|uniref:sigma-70 family RNA polymerase sigma factor n=1 Tax=Paenibacillus sp. UNC499MF TaxID=1502751 RepID=UPI00089FC192|nr:sigma-70 family RNA polymerase sigma factor [Paenibacillus sp. UNC499MF]SEG61318.1 RNA polymerase sigma-70 factor, ECF subfamily [Paenibacillus sp. UNC499MF]